jgi:hypothetical protein
LLKDDSVVAIIQYLQYTGIGYDTIKCPYTVKKNLALGRGCIQFHLQGTEQQHMSNQYHLTESCIGIRNNLEVVSVGILIAVASLPSYLGNQYIEGGVYVQWV